MPSLKIQCVFFYNPYTAVNILLLGICFFGYPSAQLGRLTIIPPEPCPINGQYSAGFSSIKKLKIKPIAFNVVSVTSDVKILNKSPQHHT